MRIAVVGDLHYEKYLDEFKKELEGLSEIDLFLLTKNRLR
ncbi:MAG: metallophosphoesterase [Methanomassiliicoccales archaeon]|nr:MAG: metallophosphoesterase [Methanomassiliicoccales archaeon]